MTVKTCEIFILFMRAYKKSKLIYVEVLILSKQKWRIILLFKVEEERCFSFLKDKLRNRLDGHERPNCLQFKEFPFR